MATFRVHEDLEKENRKLISSKPNPIALKRNVDKRNVNVFGNLDNKHSENVQRAKVEQISKPLGKLNDEYDYIRHVLGANTGVAPAGGKHGERTCKDQQKAFCVYEDTSNVPDDKENVFDVSANVSTCSMRNPLSEIKDDQLITTPMSVTSSDEFIPMSVDKSVMLDESSCIVMDITLPKNDRERFFEVEEYQQDILEYLKEAETRNRPKHGYMNKQPDITHSMRTILVDWLVEVCEEYKLQSETLCLAISYIDRFLSYMSVVRAKLQLVGTAAMFIASKYEEIYPPDVSEFVYITDDTYTKKQVLRMEQLILKVLSFDLSIPTPLVFISLYTVLHSIPEKVKLLSMFLCELSLLEADPYLQYSPSIVSAAALALSRHILNLPMWNKELEESLGYRLQDMKIVLLQLNQSHKMSVGLGQQAIQEKYKNSKNLEVSLLNPSELDENIFNEIVENIKSAEQNGEHEKNEDVRQMISSLIFT